MNSSRLALLFVVVALSGAAAGALTSLLLNRASTASRATPASSSPVLGSQPDDQLLARIDALAAENRSLHERLAALELRPEPAERTPVGGFVVHEELDALREEVRRSLAERDLPAPQPEAFKEQVADALSTIRKEEAVASVRKKQEARSERLEEDLVRIEEWLGLSGYQVSEMRAALVSQYEREDELRRLWEDGVEDEILGERKRNDRALFFADVQRTLNAEQYATFTAKFGGPEQE